MAEWFAYTGSGVPGEGLARVPSPPPWRQFTDKALDERGEGYQASPEEVELVNVALFLRRPLLITGRPGVGKSTLAYGVAHELRLGEVLRWSITTRSNLPSGLYAYDAIARLGDASLERSRAESRDPALKASQAETSNLPDIGRYLRLGPLGTALLPRERPRVLLIDEIDKSDIDLPNDLLHIFEEGEFEIPELARLPEEMQSVEVPTYDGKTIAITRGHVRCGAFPFVVMTSNGEREFPPAFIRRCIRLEMRPPDPDQLARIVTARLGPERARVEKLIAAFVRERDVKRGDLATDQLLNAVYFALHGIDPLARDQEQLRNALWKALSEATA